MCLKGKAFEMKIRRNYFQIQNEKLSRELSNSMDKISGEHKGIYACQGMK